MQMHKTLISLDQMHQSYGNYSSHGVPYRVISRYHHPQRSISGAYVLPIKMMNKSLDKHHDDSANEISSSSKIDQKLCFKITSLTTAISGNEFAEVSGAKTVCICYYEQENNWWVSKLIRKKHDSSVTSVAWHPNNAFNMNTLDKIQRITVKDLADLGLIKLQQGRKDSWFIPTKLATNLSISLSDSSSRKMGYVVVETNFRLYAYSTSKLHCEILRLFARSAECSSSCCRKSTICTRKCHRSD